MNNCSQIFINPQGTRRFGLRASSAATLPDDDHQRQSRTDLVTRPARLPRYAGRWICRHGRWERRRTSSPTGCWWQRQTTQTRPPCWAGDPAVVVPAALKLHVLRWVWKFSRFCSNFQVYKLEKYAELIAYISIYCRDVFKYLTYFSCAHTYFYVF